MEIKVGSLRRSIKWKRKNKNSNKTDQKIRGEKTFQ